MDELNQNLDNEPEEDCIDESLPLSSDANFEVGFDKDTDTNMHKYASTNTSAGMKDEPLISQNSCAETKLEKRLIMKNVVLISVSLLLIFVSYGGLEGLQSSLHRVQGMGVITQSIVYGINILSCLTLPMLMINTLGHKWTLSVSFCGYIAWMAANGYAVWATMIPGVILVGIFSATMWTAQCTYFIIVAARYAEITGETKESVLSMFFALFSGIFQINGIIGSIVSVVILNPKDSDYVPDESILEFCGKNYCPDVNITNPNLHKPSDKVMWTLVGVYLGIAVLAVFLTSIFVDPLPDRYKKREKIRPADIMQFITAAAKQVCNKTQLILIPMNIVNGLEMAFYSADFTMSYMTCTVGLWKVGLSAISFCAVNSIVSFIISRLVKYTGRFPIFVGGFVVEVACLITLMLWLPHPKEEYVLYILSGMAGFGYCIRETQLNALYGAIFASESEAAFSFKGIWESVGYAVGFSWSAFLCTSVKIYILTSLTCLGFTGLLVVEYQQSRIKKFEAISNT